MKKQVEWFIFMSASYALLKVHVDNTNKAIDQKQISHQHLLTA